MADTDVSNDIPDVSLVDDLPDPDNMEAVRAYAAKGAGAAGADTSAAAASASDLAKAMEEAAAAPAPTATPDDAEKLIDAPAATPAAVAVEPAAAAAEPAAVAEVVTPAAPPEWKTLDDVKIDAVPEAHRPWVEQAAKVARAEVAAARQDAALARTTAGTKAADLDALITELKTGGAEGIGERSTYVQNLQTAVRAAQIELAEAQWSAFNARNPGYAALPQAARDEFASILSQGAIDRMPGDKLGDRLDYALSFVKHRHNVVTPVAAAAPVTPAAEVRPAPKAPATVDPAVARKQGAVITGRVAVQKTAVPLEDRDPMDILDQHAHLLG